MPRPDSAAAKLSSLPLGNGWTVIGEVQRSPAATGGNFSHSYRVRHEDGRLGFLKAFDFSEAFDPDADTITVLRLLTTCFEHERDILLHCKDRRHSKVSLPIVHGRVQVPDLNRMEGTVYYLIFELADGDIRGQVDLSNRFDTLWCMRALTDVCLGLWQVHREMIAHQDIKPSNVLMYNKAREFRVADFGRASRLGASAPHDSHLFPGDGTYAPPEFLYGFANPDFVKRRIGCDLFMLGNIACFLFAGINIMSGLISHLAPQYRPGTWSGTYNQVLPYLNNAFTLTLEDIRSALDADIADGIMKIIRELCNPDLGFVDKVFQPQAA